MRTKVCGATTASVGLALLMTALADLELHPIFAAQNQGVVPASEEELVAQIAALGYAGSIRNRSLLCGQTVHSDAVGSGLGILACFFGPCRDRWWFPSFTRQTVAVGLKPDGAMTMTLLGADSEVLGSLSARALELSTLSGATQAEGVHAIELRDAGSSHKPYDLSLVCGNRCSPDRSNLCLAANRFRVQVAWQNPYDGSAGFGQAIRRSDVAGFFSFGDPRNPELLVKVLPDGEGTFSVYYGELTSLPFKLAVSDMNDPLQRTKTYTNTPGDCGAIDDDFFADADVQKTAAEREVASGPTGRGCKGSKTSLCLLRGRFEVTVSWHNQFDGSRGTGRAQPLSSVAGAFSFSDPRNVELVAKVLDFGDRVAVFYATLSNLEYDLRVRDTTSGRVNTYHNGPGRYCGGRDDSAFE